MYYRKNFDSLNTSIEAVIKLDNEFFKLTIEICYSKTNNKIKSYLRYISYWINKYRLITNSMIVIV